MKRKSGVLMHVSSLWGEYSEGSFGKAAMEWIDFLADCGFSVWQTLPFCLPDEVNSPYKSYSAFSTNPYFIDLPSLFEEGLITKNELECAKQDSPYICEFRRLNTERMRLLAKAASRFEDNDKLEAFMKKHPKTEEFCKFMALRTANDDKEWTEWTVNTPDADTYNTWRFVQYKFFEQWLKIKEYANGKGISIIGDIPIYVALDSADVWASPELFQLDKDNKPTGVAGVPPDYFSKDGQLWGNPLYDWDKMEKDGFSWWKERIRFMTELFDGVRIDHFRGLEAYFCIPATDTTAKNGKWVKGPGMKLINVLKEECGEKLLIAEDLGDITPEVYELVKESGFPGMKVFQFAFLGDSDSPHLPHNYPSNCIAYTGTHDNETMLGYIWEIDGATRRKMFDYCGYYGDNWDESRLPIILTMLRSHADTVIFPIQDLLFYGRDTRLNIPGKGEGNWGFRITKEQIDRIDKNELLYYNQLYGRI